MGEVMRINLILTGILFLEFGQVPRVVLAQADIAMRLKYRSCGIIL